MSDIFQEVDEEVRRDKAAEFWAKYQLYILAAALLIVLATAAYRFYDYRQAQAAEAAGAAFQDALTLDHDGKSDEARAAIAKIAASAPRGYALLGRFVEASLTAKTDLKAGVAAFEAIAGDASVDPLLRDAARLRAALGRLGAGETEAGKAALEALAGAGGAYRNTARLTLGALALQAKDYAAAGKQLDLVVSDPDSPSGDRESAQTLLGIVASEGHGK